MAQKTRNFFITINNFNDETLSKIKETECVAMCVGKHTAPTTGMLHYHVAIAFANARSYASMHKWCGATDVEKLKGTWEEARVYCQGTEPGDGIVHEQGTPPVTSRQKGEMERDRWAAAFAAVSSGDLDSVPKDILCNHLKSIEYAVDRVKCSKRKLETMSGDIPHRWYYGGTGTGKSRSAREEFPDAYIKDPQTAWWNGYDGQEVVIIEDWDKFQVKQGGDLKRWLDRYTFQAQVKNGQMLIRPQLIIVTSQYLPEEIWTDEKTVDAIRRRITVRHFREGPFNPLIEHSM